MLGPLKDHYAPAGAAPASVSTTGATRSRSSLRTTPWRSCCQHTAPRQRRLLDVTVRDLLCVDSGTPPDGFATLSGTAARSSVRPLARRPVQPRSGHCADDHFSLAGREVGSRKGRLSEPSSSSPQARVTGLIGGCDRRRSQCSYGALEERSNPGPQALWPTMGGADHVHS